MQVKNAIILSAGKGTRMGPIGEVLAKPVWPYFGKTLLELQISFLAEYGIENFYINSHHLYEQLKFLESNEIKIIYEPKLLDQGGGVLNIATKFKLWDKPVLINNADQLYFISKHEYAEAIEKLSNADAVLFCLKVKKEDGYNQLSIDSNNRVTKIIKNKEIIEDQIQTYSGMALVKCKEETYNGEILPFFKSVADLEKKQVISQKVHDAEYFDFGKLDSYYQLCFNTLKLSKAGKPSHLLAFLNKIGIKIDTTKDGLNFSSDSSLKVETGKILLNEGEIFLKDEKIQSRLNSKK